MVCASHTNFSQQWHSLQIPHELIHLCEFTGLFFSAKMNEILQPPTFYYAPEGTDTHICYASYISCFLYQLLYSLYQYTHICYTLDISVHPYLRYYRYIGTPTSAILSMYRYIHICYTLYISIPYICYTLYPYLLLSIPYI